MVGDGSFELAFEQRPNYLFVRVSGVNGRLDTTIAYWTAIAAEVRRRKPRCLMVHDEMLGETPPPEELQRLIQAMAGLGFEGVRVAYVEAHASQLPEVQHGEIFAREAGFQGRVFGNEDEAALWLRFGHG